MRTLISLGMAAFVLGFILPADLVAGEKETEMKLKKEGWVKLSVEEVKAHKNYTAVGDTGWARYVDPTGTKYVWRYDHGAITPFERKVTAEGKDCIRYSRYSTGPWKCSSIWKRGKSYVRLRPTGLLSPKYEIKPGNTENL